MTDLLSARILKILRQAKSPVSLNELMRRLELRSAHRRLLRQTLRELLDSGAIRELSNKHYAPPGVTRKSGIIEGRLSISAQGFGFVRPKPSEDRRVETPPDIFIAPRDLQTAMEGDTVAVVITSRGEGKSPNGQIQNILERAHETIPGWFQRTSSRSGRVTPRNPRLGRIVEIRKRPEGGWPADFEWVVVRVTQFTPHPDPLAGEIVEILGDDDTPGIDVLLLVRERGIVAEFPREVEEEAAGLRVDWQEELRRRRDLRAQPVVTIDPLTAKDFDDALAIERIEPSGPDDVATTRLWVHIADVGHFIAEDGAIDREALRRGNSIYPVDRVIPMLPERLSTDLCSLRPGADRLCMTVEMDITDDGHVARSRFYRSVIHSAHRLNYEEVQAFFDGTDPDLAGRMADVAGPLHALRALARLLRKQRLRRGALDLDIPEVQVLFDARGKPSNIRHAPRLESHQVVEECMLLANETVARQLTLEQYPMLYRVHEPAEPAALERLEPLLRVFGIRASFTKNRITPAAIQSALAQAEKRPAGHIFRRLILRALSRARYHPENLGHFGLASPCYCHFTSPIRRYPDLVVHRMLGRWIDTQAPPDDQQRREWRVSLAEIARQTSDTERLAQEIEWDTTTLKSLEFMQDHLGEEFDGYIAGVQSYGLYVELDPYPVEGMIPPRGLPMDRYQVDETGAALVGARRGCKYRLGDRVRVRIERIDLANLQMDLRLIV